MKSKCEIILALLNIFIDIATCSSECQRPHNDTCCYNEYFDSKNNTCRECKPGRIGWNCNYSCAEGYYGRLCKHSCTCNFNDCDPEVGCQLQATNSYNSTDSSQNINNEYNRKILHSISKQLKLMSNTLFLIVGCVIILILGQWYIIWKCKIKPGVRNGMKQIDTHTINNPQSIAVAMERGYTALSNGNIRNFA
ncbi:uncharacterized protein LOC134274134 [Saccostrea cucullata]|uniref:uncharacterized protein LOC134274134 n=1 Tax=Saccostrea cuccullata TaxID=36930 RepID=UPI002ED1B409